MCVFHHIPHRVATGGNPRPSLARLFDLPYYLFLLTRMLLEIKKFSCSELKNRSVFIYLNSVHYSVCTNKKMFVYV